MAVRPAALIAALLLPALTLASRAAHAEAGVLVPANVSIEPDPKILALKDLDVSVQIDHLHAQVRMKQIFENRGDRTLEARYVLALGEGASVEDFAVWDGEERLRGVVVEKARGRRLFEQLSAERIDPGLAESEDEGDKGRQFALRVSPLPPGGTARVEIVFTEDLRLSGGAALFTLPLAARRFGALRAERVRVEIQQGSAWPLAGAKIEPPALFRDVAPPGPGGVHALWEARGATLDRDVTLELRFDLGRAVARSLAYRDPRPRLDLDPFAPAGPATSEDRRGFVLIEDAFAPRGATRAAPRDLALLLDTSLSMGGEKLDRAFAALSAYLGRLQPADRFAVVLYGDQARPLRPALQPASAAAVAEALRLVRGSYLAGGTSLSAALEAGARLLPPAPGRERALLLIGDGHASRGELSRKALAARAAAMGGAGAPIFCLAIGDDANVEVLRALAAQSGGAFGWVREGGGAADFTVRSLFDQIGQPAWQGLRLAGKGAVIDQVLSATPGPIFAGGEALLVGRYAPPDKGKGPLAAQAQLQGTLEGRPFERSVPLSLPAEDRAHPFIGRLWARLRIDELLARIADAGEEEAFVREIVALARQFRLVTPYTSFLAAPRALLRPRSIQPGDPVLQVRAPRGTTAVAALFPFGLQKALRRLPGGDLWETRFVAPPWMKDGAYQVSLVLTDERGRKRREDKRFVIDSRAPTPRLRGPLRPARPGDTLRLVADADADVRRLEARLGDGPQVPLRWDPAQRGSVGALLVPPDLAPGRYALTLLAEDAAHNVATAEVRLDVLPGGAP